MHRFTQVDVFTDRLMFGNPVAVVHDADELTTQEMADFARWTNLSETTFLCTPTDERADYQVRIFTTRIELPFAGHPTLGSAHAWLEAGGIAKDPESHHPAVRSRTRTDSSRRDAACLRCTATDPEWRGLGRGPDGGPCLSRYRS